jgi:hypothetical protein
LEDATCDSREVIKLREAVHQLEVHVAVQAAEAKASEKALVLARNALEHAQAASNEWRQENIDQRALFMTEDKVRGLFETEAAERRSLESRILSLEKIKVADTGRSSAFSSVWVVTTTIAFIVIAAVGLIVRYVGR